MLVTADQLVTLKIFYLAEYYKYNIISHSSI